MSPNEDPDRFWEDAEKREEELRKWRHGLSDEKLTKQRDDALAQIDVLRESRTRPFDPGGAAPKKRVATLSRAPKGTRVAEVDNPHREVTGNFATACVEVENLTTQSETVLKLRLRRGAQSRLEMSAAKLFRFHPKTRQWNLVERSGYNAKYRYVWGLVHRPGIYAAIALPKNARDVALERFAYHYMWEGVKTGVFAQASDYFDEADFLQLVEVKHDIKRSRKADRERLTSLRKIHRETRKLRRHWRRQLPSGILPEWQLIDHLSTTEPANPGPLGAVGVLDLVREVPTAFQTVASSGRWHRLGPRNVSGRIRSLAIHPSNGSILYAGAATGGVWKTTDGGDSWFPLWTFEEAMSFGSLAIAPSEPTTIYAATGEMKRAGSLPAPFLGAGVYRSTDAGESWTHMCDWWEVGKACSKLVVHPEEPDTIYVASNIGIFRSTTGGEHLDHIHWGTVTDLIIARDDPETLYCGIQNDGVYKTSDGGNSWDRISSDVTYPTYSPVHRPFPTGDAAGWIKLAIGRSGPTGSNLVIAKLGDGRLTLCSGDGGSSWVPLMVSEGAYNPGQAIYTSFVSINPIDSRRIHVGSVDLSYTTDGWQFRKSRGTHHDHHDIAYDPSDPDVCYAATDGGVYKSSDSGATWHLASLYLQTAQHTSLGVSQDSRFLAGSATQDQGIQHTDGLTDWRMWGGGVNEWGFCVVDPNDSDNVFIAPGIGWLLVSHDRGQTYSPEREGLTDYWASQDRQTRPAEFEGVAVQPGNSRLVIGAAYIAAEEVLEADGSVDAYALKPRIYYSLNGGRSWQVAFEPPERPTCVAFAPSSGLRAYAATFDGRFFRSDECGTGGWWEPPAEVDPADRPPNKWITCIAVDHDDPDRVYIGYHDQNPHVYRSLDGGQRWEPASGILPQVALPDIRVNALVVDSENDDVIFAGTDVGLFRSDNGGATWSFYHDGIDRHDLPRVAVKGLAHRRLDNQLVAATYGRGAYYTHKGDFRNLQVLAISHLFRAGTRTPWRGIERLRVTDGAETWVASRREVINYIQAGANVYTRGIDGSRGEVQIEGTDSQHPREYLRTHPDATTADNLLSLPEF